MSQFTPFSLNIKGKLRTFTRPLVMGILNVTDDSFFAGSRTGSIETIERRVLEMTKAGADIIDIGGCSTRPGFVAPDADEEWRRVKTAWEIVKALKPDDVLVSVDTFRGSVARLSVEAGIDILNDISAFTLDDDMFDAVVELNVPYVLTHPSVTSLTPETDAAGTQAIVLRELGSVLHRLTSAGVSDVILDPGLGFGKTVAQNYALVRGLDALNVLGCPVLVGASRKSMIYKPLGLTPDDALPGTVAIGTVALLKGASILRVHDVAACRQTVEVVRMIKGSTDS